MISAPSSSRLGVLTRAGFFVVLTAAVLEGGLAAPAEAAAKRRVGVSLTGTPAGPVRGAIGNVLKKHGFEAVTPDLSGDSEDAIASAAKQGKLSAVIVGDVRDGGKRLKLRVYSGTGDLIGEGSWAEKGKPKKLAAAVKRTLWARIGGPLSKARPPAAGAGKAEKAEPAPAAPEEEAPAEPSTYSRSKEAAEPDEDEDEGEGEKKKPSASTKKKPAKEESGEGDEAERAVHGAPSAAAGPALEFLIGPRFVGRNLDWKQSGADFPPYSLALAPAVGAALAWFPAAHFTGGWVSNLGLAFSAEYVPGVTSATSNGSKYPTQLSDYNGGLRGRMAFGRVTGALTLGAGQHAMIFRSGTMADGTTLAPRSTLVGTPDVKYIYARAGLDVSIALPAHLSLALGGGYRHVLSAGDVNYMLQTPMYLPSATIVAFDVAASLGYRILPALEARLGFDLRRYQISAGTNTHMVTSGTDQYTAVWAALVVRVGAKD